MIPYSYWPNYDKIIRKKIDKILISGKTNYFNGKEGINFEKFFKVL